MPLVAASFFEFVCLRGMLPHGCSWKCGSVLDCIVLVIFSLFFVVASGLFIARFCVSRTVFFSCASTHTLISRRRLFVISRACLCVSLQVDIDTVKASNLLKPATEQQHPPAAAVVAEAPDMPHRPLVQGVLWLCWMELNDVKSGVDIVGK